MKTWEKTGSESCLEPQHTTRTSPRPWLNKQKQQREKIRPSRLRLHGCRRCWNPFLRLLLFLDNSRMFTPRSVAPFEGLLCWSWLSVSHGEASNKNIYMYFCWWFLVYESILTNYPLKKGCYPFAVLVWTVKIRCFGATKKEWKTCFSPNTRPFARRSFKNTGTDLSLSLYIYVYTDTFKILATTQNHQIQRSLEDHHITNLTSAQRGIDCLTFHDLPWFFAIISPEMLFLIYSSLATGAFLQFLDSWSLVINESNYTC